MTHHGKVQSNLKSLILTWQAEHNDRLPYAQLAEDTGLSTNFVYRLYHDNWQHMDREKLQALCDFFDCTPNDLLWGNERDDGVGELAAED